MPISIDMFSSSRVTLVTFILGFFILSSIESSFPLSLLAIIFTVPSFNAVIFPLSLTVAIDVLLLFHVILLFVEFDGSIVAVNLYESPIVNSVLSLFWICIEVTALVFVLLDSVFFVASVDDLLFFDDVFVDELFLLDVDLLELLDCEDEYGHTPFECKCGGWPPQW